MHGSNCTIITLPIQFTVFFWLSGDPTFICTYLRSIIIACWKHIIEMKSVDKEFPKRK